MPLSTFPLLVNEIRENDIISDGKITYTAWRDAEYVPSTGMVNVVDKNYGHHDYDKGTMVTVTAEIDDEYQVNEYAGN